jgi:hypothetical protein
VSILFQFVKTLHHRMLELVKLRMNKCFSISFFLFFYVMNYTYATLTICFQLKKKTDYEFFYEVCFIDNPYRKYFL